jgi:large subunit ribosomal protein L10
MAISKDRKKVILASLEQKFGDAKSVFFTNYSGLSVQDVSKVRNALREEGAEMVVAKKTLIQLAASKNGVSEIPSEAMEGPIAAVFSYEEGLAGPQKINSLAKDHEQLALTGGIMEGEAFGKEKAVLYANTPTRSELYASLVGSLNAPISGFHGVLHGTMRQFVGTLQAIADKGE